MNKLEVAEARRQLKLRKHPEGYWEVYACIHGTQTFRWWRITDDTKAWYKRHFPEIKEIEYEYA